MNRTLNLLIPIDSDSYRFTSSQWSSSIPSTRISTVLLLYQRPLTSSSSMSSRHKCTILISDVLFVRSSNRSFSGKHDWLRQEEIIFLWYYINLVSVPIWSIDSWSLSSLCLSSRHYSKYRSIKLITYIIFRSKDSWYLLDIFVCLPSLTLEQMLMS